MFAGEVEDVLQREKQKERNTQDKRENKGTHMSNMWQTHERAS